MAKSKIETEMCKHECKPKHHGMSGGGLYGVGFIGAAVYYIQHAQNFQAGVVGILKAAVWPALFVYSVLELLKF